MFAIRASGDRGHTQTPWLNSRHTFSFGSYYDPRYLGFSDLRVINDDVVAPAEGFGTHPHKNMEIVTVVLDGELEHRDSMGNRGVIKACEIQKMSAGSGITHSEMNPSLSKPVHFLQIWIEPNIDDVKPEYMQAAPSPQELKSRLVRIASPKSTDSPITLHQNAEIYQTLLEQDKTVSFDITPAHKVWIHVATGAVSLDGHPLIAGDGVAVADETAEIRLRGIDPLSNVLIFKLRA